MMNKEDVDFMKRILPKHYICEPREKGVHCYSNEGIPDDQGKDDHWEIIQKAIEQKFGDRLMEIFFQVSTNYMKFTVYLRPPITD